MVAVFGCPNTKEKEQPFKCDNYRTLSLICHVIKVMLKVLQCRLSAAAEDILVEEQVGFREGCSMVEHMFSIRMLMEKHLLRG